jgi:two-component system, NtrC family, nitrogen regulation sensor histidine kinase NtrY
MGGTSWFALAGVALLAAEASLQGTAPWLLAASVAAAVGAVAALRRGGARAIAGGQAILALLLGIGGARVAAAVRDPDRTAAGVVRTATADRDRALVAAVANARQVARNVLQRIGTADPGVAPAIGDLLEGSALELGVTVLAGDTVVAVSGPQRVAPVALDREMAALVETPFARVLVLQDSRGTRRARITLLLEASPALPAPGASLARGTGRPDQITWRWAEAPPVQRFATGEEALRAVAAQMTVEAAPPSALVARESTIARRLGAGGLVALGIITLTASAPLAVRVGAVLIPTWVVARTLAGPETVAVLLAVGMLFIGLMLWRRPPRRSPVGIAASMLLLTAAPVLVALAAWRLAEPLGADPLLGWFGWQLILAVGTAGLLAIASAPLRAEGDAEASPRWGLVAIALAVLVGVLGIEAWRPADVGAWSPSSGIRGWTLEGWLAWYRPLWLLPLAAMLPVMSARVRLAALATTAGILAALGGWSATLDHRRMLADADLDRVEAASDPAVSTALERLGVALADGGVTRLDRAYAIWRQSEVATLEAPSQLAIWEGGRVVEWVTLDALALSWDDLEQVVSAEPRVVRRVAMVRGIGRHEVLAVPVRGDTVVTVAVGPRTGAIAPTRFGRLLGWRTGSEPAFRMSVVGDAGARADGEWHRRGRFVRARRAIPAAAGRMQAVATVEMSSPRPFAVRAALVVALDALLVLAAWAALGRLIGTGILRAPGLFQRSWRRTIATTLAAFFIVPAALFTLVSGLRLREDAARARADDVSRALRDAAIGRDLSASDLSRADAARLARVADNVDAEIALFRDGRLAVASSPLLGPLGIVGPVLDPRSTRGSIGEPMSLPAAIPGLPVRLGVEASALPGTLIAAALPGGDSGLAREQVDLGLQLLLITLFGGIAAVVTAGAVARALGQPIEALRQTAIAIGRREPLPATRTPPAEFAPVFGAIAQMTRDLADRSAQLEADRSRTAAILSTVATGVIGVDADGRVIQANPRAEELIGHRLVLGEALVSQLAPAWQSVADGVTRLLGPHTRDAESREITVDDRLLALTLAPLGDGGLVLALTDITEASRAARIVAWGEMARQVAHEIKNPLTPMRLGLQHLRRLRADGRPEFAEQVDQTAERLLAEIDRLDRIARSFARYGAPPEREAGPLEAIDLAGVLGELVGLYRLASESLEIVITGAAGDRVAARREELLQVVLNLLDNARSAGARRVELVLASGELVVRDNGVGIPADQLSRIFEPTFSTTTSGTGLGLAIVRRLVEGWRGVITVASTVGEGTAFVLRFAKAPQPPGPAARSS